VCVCAMVKCTHRGVNSILGACAKYGFEKKHFCGIRLEKPFVIFEATNHSAARAYEFRERAG
jgi:hypothetical protein